MSYSRICLVFVLATALASPGCAEEPPQIMTADALQYFELPAADARISYGDDTLQFGDLRLPPGDGPHPVIVFIHGGCWLAEYDIAHTNKLTAALAGSGIATWSLEYRRVGDEGGGWPGTFNDIGRGTDHLRAIAEEHNLNLDRVITMGHSAGGHLAVWTAARSQIAAGTPVSSMDPLPVKGVVALAPAADLEMLHEQQVCGHVIDKLMGGSPSEVPDRYRWSSPMQLAATGVPQKLIIGKYDSNWAPSGLSYFAAAKERGDMVEAIEATESGHFEVIDPDSTTWPLVLEAAQVLLGITAAEK